MADHIVIIGASHAGVAVATELRAQDADTAITLISNEAAPPYQRPPLSKAYMSGDMSLERLALRAPDWFNHNNIDLRLSTSAQSIDPLAKTVSVSSGGPLTYTKLVLATGADARTLPGAIGGNLANVHVMRTLADADALMAKMAADQRLVVIGGGYIGLEAAAEARKKKLSVTVIEAAPRILQRVACAETSDAFRAIHIAQGVKFREATGCARIISDDEGNAIAVETTDGAQIECDLVIVGIGIIPNTALAIQAGLTVDSAIVVNAQGQTSDPDIYACGDNALLPFDGQPTRLESVQNANDQAVIVARNALGFAETYTPMPWFWSDQYDVKLQIAGFNRGYTDILIRPGKREGSVSHFYFDTDRFIAVDCLNDAATYAISRKILTEGKALTPSQVVDPAFILKSVLTA